MKKFLKLFIFIMIIIFSPNVFAASYNVTNKIHYSTDTAGGTYYGDEIYLGGYNGVFSVNNRYNGRLSQISFYVDSDDWDWGYNKTYTVTMEMATEDWRNNFMNFVIVRANSDGSIPSTSNNTMYVNGSFQFVSMKKVTFRFKTGSTMGPYTKFTITSSNYMSTAFTGVNNWNLSKITISDYTASTPTPAPVTPTPAPSGATNQDIINNNNSNTQSIIDNQNQNTSDIIDNNNSNTKELIESTQTCYTANDNIPISLVPGFELIGSGSGFSPNLTWEISSFIPIYEGISYASAGWSSSYYCVYDINFNLRMCGSNTKYVAKSGDAFLLKNSTISGASNPRIWGEGNYCVKNTDIELRQRALESKGLSDKQQETNDKLNDINDSINNSNIDSGVGSDFFDDFEDNSHGLTGIITAPLTAIQRITSSTCQPLNVPIPFTNGSVNLPCMTEIYEQNIPTIYNIWKIISFGIIAYFICIDIFHIVKGFKDPETDKVEVLDL